MADSNNSVLFVQLLNCLSDWTIKFVYTFSPSTQGGSSRKHSSQSVDLSRKSEQYDKQYDMQYAKILTKFKT